MITRVKDGFEIEIKVQPFIFKGLDFLVFNNPNEEFIIDQVSWKFRYHDVGIPGARAVTLKPIKVTIGTILVNAETASQFNGPQKIIGTAPITVENTNIVNNHQLKVSLFLKGKNPPILKVGTTSNKNTWAGACPIGETNKTSPSSRCDCPIDLIVTQGCKVPTHF
jgi:hypothetical protein